jgi:hypothetical protein
MAFSTTPARSGTRNRARKELVRRGDHRIRLLLVGRRVARSSLREHPPSPFLSLGGHPPALSGRK